MNKNYFDNIDTETKAYLLGFILGDGWVTANGRVLGLAVVSSDVDVLLLLKRELGSTHKIQTRVKNRTTPLSRLEISCTALVTALNRLGITSNKSLEATLPSIQNTLMPHMLRGLFDGDGSFSGLRQPALASSSRVLLDDINAWLSKEVGITCPIYASKGRKNTSYKLVINRPQECVAHLMYKNSSTVLLRKKEQYVEYTKLMKSKV